MLQHFGNHLTVLELGKKSVAKYGRFDPSRETV